MKSTVKSTKLLSIVLSTIIMTGCAEKTAAGPSRNAADTSVVQTESLPEDTTAVEKKLHESEKTFERVSLLEYSAAEQIYKSIYNYAEYEYYKFFEAQRDVDYEDEIYINSIILPVTFASEDEIGKTHTRTFCRIVNGKMSDGAELAMWIDSFASAEYVDDKIESEFEDNFIVKDGNIYVDKNYFGTNLSPVCTSGVTIEKITQLSEDTVQVDLSYIHYYYSDNFSKEYASFKMNNRNNGWKIESVSNLTARKALINQLFNHDALKGDSGSDLLAQIKNCLEENQIS